MSDAATERFSRPRGQLVLWAGLLVPPGVWMLDLLVIYSLERYVCRTGAMWLFHLTTAVMLLPVIAVGWVAWRAWRQVGSPLSSPGGDVRARSGFMALSGVALSVAFALLIIAEWIPTLILEPCGGGLMIPPSQTITLP